MTFYPVYEASNPLEEAANGVALKILSAQKKMGALKGINLKVMSLDDSRKERLKKAGILVGAGLAGAALGFMDGMYGDKIKAKVGSKVGSGVNRAKGTKVGAGLAGEYSKAKGFAGEKASAFKSGKFGQGATKRYGNSKDFVTGKYNAVKDSKLGKVATKHGDKAVAVAALGAAGGLAYTTRNKRYVIIEAKYAYGTKMFQVYSAPAEEADNIGKTIIRAVNKEVSQLKSSVNFPVKEDFTLMEEHTLFVQELIIEEVLSEDIW